MLFDVVEGDELDVCLCVHVYGSMLEEEIFLKVCPVPHIICFGVGKQE